MTALVPVCRIPPGGRFKTSLTNRLGERVPGLAGIHGAIWVEFTFPTERKAISPEVMVVPV